jgi:hypothetical protein
VQFLSHRKRFFVFFEGKPLSETLFFPDITSWYENTRKNFGEPEIFGAGRYIPNSSDFYKRPSRLDGALGKLTFTEIYREFDWGLPVHIGEWQKTSYTGGVEVTTTNLGKTKRIDYKTPKGDLYRIYQLDQDGSWAPREYLFKRDGDFEIMKYIISHTKFSVDFTSVEEFFRETAGFGVCDLAVRRSPFGKLVHEYLGFEEIVYKLYDEEKTILSFMEAQEELDLKLIELAATGPAKIVIISDHADENLISPRFYKDYCIPFYRKACAILKSKGMYVSTHLDGNFKNYLPFITDTDFDLLDGCTPWPMFNYTPEQLAEAIRGKQNAYLGVPASMFVQQSTEEEVLSYGKRILDAFEGRVILNVGDILPIDGSIESVIALGRMAKSYPMGGNRN